MQFGFFFYVMSVVNWGNWPWAQLQLLQPWLGFGQITFLILPITVCYMVLAVPGFATWAAPSAAWLENNTLIGWNWPWRLTEILPRSSG